MILQIKSFQLQLISEIQHTPRGRPVLFRGSEKLINRPSKWINREERHHWLFHFRYNDVQYEYIRFEFDFEDKFVQAFDTNYNVLKL